MEKINFSEFKILALISFVATCGMLGTDIHLASIPHIMTYMHTDKVHMQQSVSIYLLGMGLSLLFYGPLSDKYGRKPVVIFGLTVASIASFIAVFVNDINSFLLLRLLQGMGSGVCLGVGRTIVADVLTGERLAFAGSYFSLFLSISPLLAPTIGGYVQQWWGWKANFIILGILLVVSLFMYARFCPETNHHKNPRAFSLPGLYFSYKSLLSHITFMGATLLTGILAAAAMIYATTSPIIFQTQYHMSPVAYGWITAFAAVGGFTGKLITPFFVRKIGSQKTLFMGLILLLLVGISLTFFYLVNFITIPLIIIAVFLVICSQALVIPWGSSRALSSFPEKRGAAGALYGGFQMLVAFLASSIAGWMQYDGIGILTLSYLVLGILGMVIYWKLLLNLSNF